MATSKPHMVRLDTQEIIPVDRKLTLGRHPGCDYVVTINNENVGISGRHASIEVDGDYAWIEDLGSTNGTWVRGARIERRTPLLPGERFLLDSMEFEYRAAAQAGVASAAPVADKTVLAGRRAMDLPPVPVSIEDSAPRLAPVPMPQPLRAPAAPMRVAPLASREPPVRRSAAPVMEVAPEPVKPARSTLRYLILLGFAVLAGAAVAVLVSR